MSEITDAIKESVLGLEQQKSWDLLEAGGAGKEWGLHTAASFGDLSCVASLLQKKPCDVNKPNRTDWTALMYAAYYGHDEVVRYLLRQKAKVDMQNAEGCSALMLACKCGHENTVDILLQNGASIEMTDNRGWTALFHAVQAGGDYVVRRLLSRGANLDFAEKSSGMTATMLAAIDGNDLLVRLLLQWGANILSKDLSGYTAYVWALRAKRMNVVAVMDAYFIIKGQKVLRGDVDINLDASEISKEFENAETISETPPQPRWTNLQQLLESIGVGKYSQIFDKEEIDFPMFMTLSDQDLQDIGIKLLGPRKKMCAAIERLQKMT